MEENKKIMEEEMKIPSFGVSIFILGSLIAIMAVSLLWLNIPVHIAMAVSMAVAITALLLSGTKWDLIEESLDIGGKMSMQTILILLIIGMAMGSWMASGTVPALIYYGLKVIDPKMFLVTTFLVCCMVSIATGSSWSTVGTVGVALIAVANGLGINPAMAAGSIVAGSCFGDKMSPLSDTANLASGIAEGNVFDHIKSMLYTTTPAFLISLALFFLLGSKSSANGSDINSVNAILQGIDQTFNLNLLVWTPPIIIIVVLAIKKVPAIISLFISAIAAAVIALLFQGQSISGITTIMDTGYVSNIGIASIDSLLNRGGLQSMSYTITLTLIVMPYGALLENTQVLRVLLERFRALTKSVGALVTSTVLTAILMNIVTASQYMSIVITGKVYLQAYKDKDLLPQVLSRTLEDSGTLTSPLVPWNLCALFMAGALGVSTVTYLPYAFVNYLSPIIAIICANVGLFQWKTGEIPSVRTYRTVK